MNRILRTALVIIVYIMIFLVVASMIVLVYRWITMDDRTAEPIIVVLEVLLLPSLLWALNKLKHKSNNAHGSNSDNSYPARMDKEIFEVKILKCSIVDHLSDIYYRFQIDLALSVIGRSIYVRKIKLAQDECVVSRQNIEINYVFDSTNIDYLALPFDSYKQKIKNTARIPAREIVVKNDEWRYLMLTDIVTGERLSDGYENFIPKGWKLIIIYNDNREKTVEFDFEIHSNSEKVPVSYRYKNF